MESNVEGDGAGVRVFGRELLGYGESPAYYWA